MRRNEDIGERVYGIHGQKDKFLPGRIAVNDIRIKGRVRMIFDLYDDMLSFFYLWNGLQRELVKKLKINRFCINAAALPPLSGEVPPKGAERSSPFPKEISYNLLTW